VSGNRDGIKGRYQDGKRGPPLQLLQTEQVSERSKAKPMIIYIAGTAAIAIVTFCIGYVCGYRDGQHQDRWKDEP
jgi:hypothetical protein